MTDKMKKCPNCLGCGTVWTKRGQRSEQNRVTSMRCPVCKGSCKVPA